MLEVQRLKVHEPVAHLGVIGATGRLKLDLHVVHHDDFLGGHGLLEKRILRILEVFLVLWQVGEADRIVLLLLLHG